MVLQGLQRYEAGITLLKSFEGCRLKAYKCPAGVWTIGWGSTRHQNGRPVRGGDAVTQAMADQMLALEIADKVIPPLSAIPHWEDMAPEQQGALVSFAWNLGAGFYGADGFGTISRALQGRDWAAVPDALMLYCNPGSSFEAGVRRRRAAEGDLWRQGLSSGHQPAAAEPMEQVLAAAPAEPIPAAVEQATILFRITALQNTWLKKRPAQAAALGDAERLAVARGQVHQVLVLEEVPADAHARVLLAAKDASWFIYQPHWQVDQLSGEALPAAVDWEDFNCPITANLTVGEVLQWDRRRIPGANASVRLQLAATAAEFQRVRDAWGGPLGATSFYRPEPINEQAGGRQDSLHVSGRAMDIYPADGRSIDTFYEWIRCRWRGGLGDGRARGFIHLDTDGGGFVPGAGARPAREWRY